MEKRYKLSQDITFKAGEEFNNCVEFIDINYRNENSIHLFMYLHIPDDRIENLISGGIIEEVQEPWANDEDFINILILDYDFHYQCIGSRENSQSLLNEYKRKNKI